MNITKREIIDLDGCPRFYWLSRFQKQLAGDKLDQMTMWMVAGMRIGEAARKEFSSGRMATGGPITLERLNDIPEVLFEANFEWEGFTTRADVLTKTPEGLVITEVKGSKSSEDGVKPEHILDVAFQLYVIRKLGLKVARIELMLLNANYQLGGTEPLFVRTDVTNIAEEFIPEIERRIPEAGKLLSQDFAPDLEHHSACKPCPFHRHCWKDAVSSDVMYVPRKQSKAIKELHDNGIVNIRQLDESSLKPKSADIKVSRAEKSPNGLYINPDIVKKIPTGLLAFVDFESAQMPLPRFVGDGVWSEVPFQCSMHILDTDTGELEHFEFVDVSGADPRPGFVKSLSERLDSLGKDWKVFHYSPYEIASLTRLIKRGVPGAEQLRELFTGHAIDLMKVVEENIYHLDFWGSYSIKSVYPALIKSNPYDGLDIADGASAALAYQEATEEQTTPAKRAEIEASLKEYCQLDTLAMVDIYRFLWAEAEKLSD